LDAATKRQHNRNRSDGSRREATGRHQSGKGCPLARSPAPLLRFAQELEPRAQRHWRALGAGVVDCGQRPALGCKDRLHFG
jgi:hypothetical protein